MSLNEVYDASKRIQRGCLATILKTLVVVMFFSVLFMKAIYKYTFITFREIYIPIIIN